MSATHLRGQACGILIRSSVRLAREILQHCLLTSTPTSDPPRRILSTRAVAEEGAADDDFESRLGVLRGKRSKRAPVDPAAKAAGDETPAPKAPPKGQRRKGVADFTVVGSVEEPAGANWGAEEIVYEGPPARGEIMQMRDGAAARETYKTGVRWDVALLSAGCW